MNLESTIVPSILPNQFLVCYLCLNYTLLWHVSNKVGNHQNQHIIQISKFTLNGIFNCIITISDTLKYWWTVKRCSLLICER